MIDSKINSKRFWTEVGNCWYCGLFAVVMVVQCCISLCTIGPLIGCSRSGWTMMKLPLSSLDGLWATRTHNNHIYYSLSPDSLFWELVLVLLLQIWTEGCSSFSSCCSSDLLAESCLFNLFFTTILVHNVIFCYDWVV